MTQTVFIEAINHATKEEMRKDSNVFIMGEDITLSVMGQLKIYYQNLETQEY